MSAVLRSVWGLVTGFAGPGGWAAGLRLGRGAALAGLVTLSQLSATNAFAREYSALVIDAGTGEVLHQQDADGIRHPASLTKLMTLYLTFDALKQGKLSLGDQLPVSAHAQSMTPTKLGVRAGQSLTVEHAILGLVTHSANDAAVVLAEAIGGSEDGFAQRMTQKARQLGMPHTIFRNASGLPDDEQVTTARDLATLALALQHDHPEYYHYFSTRSFRYGGRLLPNHNHLMERYAGMDGMKTGYVSASGFNLVASAVRDGHRLIGVVMGGATTGARDARMAQLLDAAFTQVDRREPGGNVLPQTVVASADDGSPARPAKSSTRNAAHRTNKTQVAKASKTAKAPREDQGWVVQIGANYPTKAGGQKALERATPHLPRHLADDVVRRVATAKGHGGKVYHAMFVGLKEKDARAVCSSLKRAGESCTPVGPG
jgi:D-alanyl-D-alanine carboxypeptidase